MCSGHYLFHCVWYVVSVMSVCCITFSILYLLHIILYVIFLVPSLIHHICNLLCICQITSCTMLTMSCLICPMSCAMFYMWDYVVTVISRLIPHCTWSLCHICHVIFCNIAPCEDMLMCISQLALLSPACLILCRNVWEYWVELIALKNHIIGELCSCICF